MKTQNEHWRKKSYQKVTLETKILVVDQILNGQISNNQASKKYDIPRTTISYWLRKYSTLVQQNNGMSKNDEIKKLKEKICLMKKKNKFIRHLEKSWLKL